MAKVPSDMIGTIPGTQVSGNISGNAANVTGTVAIANGGTGQTTQQTALNALAGAVTSGSYLRGNGTNVALSTIQVADVPTLNQNTTGSAATLTTGRTIQTSLASTTAATFNGSVNITPGVTGTLAVTNGGTGTTTSTGSGNNVLSTSPTLTTPVIASITNTGALTLPTVTGTISAYNQVTTTSSATPAPTGDSKENELYLTAQTVGMTFTNPSGTLTNGNKLFIRVTTAASQTIAFGTAYKASGVAPLMTATVAGKTHEMQFRYNSTNGFWYQQAVDATGY